MFNRELVATIGEYWGALICIVAAITTLFHKYRTRKDLCVRIMLIAAALLLSSDAVADTLNGTPGDATRIVLQISVFIVYACSYLLVGICLTYVWQMVAEPDEPLPNIIKVFWGVLILAELVHAVGVPFNLYYYYDANNLFHRSNLFIISQLASVVGIVALGWAAINYHKRFSTYEKIAAWSYFILPPLATVLHSISFFSSQNLQQFAFGATALITFFVREADVREELVLAHQREKESNDALAIAKSQADAANEAKTIFLNNMSHDIRTPMNAILGFAELMDRKKDDPEMVSDYLSKIKISGKYLLNIINDVLDMARIESGNTTVDCSCMNLDGYDTLILDEYDSLVKQKDLSFDVCINVEHSSIFVDVPKVQQVAANLISNAIKYTPNGGHINFSVTEHESGRDGYGLYRLIVADDGIGMSEQFVEDIFDMFSRERNTTDAKIVGTGLGMSIVKKLVDLMGGTIKVESEIGKGSKFVVDLELMIVDKAHQYELQHNSDPIKTYSLDGKCILLAEDNDLNAEITITILEETGAKVERAADGVQCVDMLAQSQDKYYDIVLMDIQMPNMNGFEATQMIRNMTDATKASIPIVAMTANAFEEDKKKAIDTGMNGHIAKPIVVEEMLKTISTCL